MRYRADTMFCGLGSNDYEIAIVFMGQPDIFAAWLFTFAGRPDLTQKYTRMVPSHSPTAQGRIDSLISSAGDEHAVFGPARWPAGQ